MCGISGVHGRADAPLIAGMTRTIAHRGPDDEGVYLDEEISLGVRRLSIIDVAGEAGNRSPMKTAPSSS